MTMQPLPTGAISVPNADTGNQHSFINLLIALARHLRLLIVAPLLAGVVAFGVTFLIAPTFTARTVFLSPQQSQSMAISALASLGALSGLAGAAAGIKSPVDQYVALMQSTTVADRVVDAFQLMQVYDEKYRVEARKELARNVRIVAGKRDGMISVEVDDESPERAARVANFYVDELRRLTRSLALTEAQQRRVFFEEQLKQTKDNLIHAQSALQTSGFSSGAIKAEPRAAADAYARLRAEVTSAEVKLQTLRRNLADASPEVQQQQTLAVALRAELLKLETSTGSSNEPGYVGKYREFKYHEALFDLFSRQFELARLDESRDSALIQVVDPATVPERKSKPRRALVALASAGMALLVALCFVLLRRAIDQSSSDSTMAGKLRELRTVLARGRTA